MKSTLMVLVLAESRVQGRLHRAAVSLFHARSVLDPMRAPSHTATSRNTEGQLNVRHGMTRNQQGELP